AAAGGVAADGPVGPAAGADEAGGGVNRPRLDLGGAMTRPLVFVLGMSVAVALSSLPPGPGPEAELPEDLAPLRAKRLPAPQGPPLGWPFRGRPLSYWSWRLKQGHFRFGGWSWSLSVFNPRPWWLRGPSWTHAVLRFFGKSTAWEEETIFPVWKPESEAVAPLFVDLLKDEDPYVPEVAAICLGRYGVGRWECEALPGFLPYPGD